MMSLPKSRRSFLGRCAWAVLFLGGGTVLSRCTTNTQKQPESAAPSEFSDDPCSNLSGVSAEEIKKRNDLAYVPESPIPDNQCNNCNLYLPPKEEQACGGCMLFKGPVQAGGYCTYWAPTV